MRLIEQVDEQNTGEQKGSEALFPNDSVRSRYRMAVPMMTRKTKIDDRSSDNATSD